MATKLKINLNKILSCQKTGLLHSNTLLRLWYFKLILAKSVTNEFEQETNYLTEDLPGLRLIE